MFLSEIFIISRPPPGCLDLCFAKSNYKGFNPVKQSFLDDTGQDIYLLLHQNIDLNINRGYRVHNAEAITALLERTPAVKTVFEGHYHKGYESVHMGIWYKTFAGVCEKEQAYFIEVI